jgi:hypothetical protein
LIGNGIAIHKGVVTLMITASFGCAEWLLTGGVVAVRPLKLISKHESWRSFVHSRSSSTDFCESGKDPTVRGTIA